MSPAVSSSQWPGKMPINPKGTNKDFSGFSSQQQKKAPEPNWQPGLFIVVRLQALEAATLFVKGIHTFDGLDLDDGLAGLFDSLLVIFGYRGSGTDSSDDESDCCECT